MPNRPDNVRCETCVFWCRHGDTAAGYCHRYQQKSPDKSDSQFCGEWRDGWPREIIYIPLADSSSLAESFLSCATVQRLNMSELSKRIAVTRALLDALEANYVKKTAPS